MDKGYHKYIKSGGKTSLIDEAKVKRESRFDGKWVLQTDLDEMSAEEVALRYNQLWMVHGDLRAHLLVSP